MECPSELSLCGNTHVLGITGRNHSLFKKKNAQIYEVTFRKCKVLGEQAMLMSDILQFYFSCLALDSSSMNHALLAKCRVIKWLMQCPCNPITEKTPMTHIVIVKNQ
jgi:hypothetical protein